MVVVAFRGLFRAPFSSPFPSPLSGSFRAFQGLHVSEGRARSIIIGIYRPFSDCTRGALGHALTELGLAASVSADGVDALVASYNSLRAFPEVGAALRAVSDAGLDAYVFSNGTGDMVRASLGSSPDLAPCAGLFRAVVSAEAAGGL